MFTYRGKYVQVSIPGPCLQCLHHTEFGRHQVWLQQPRPWRRGARWRHGGGGGQGHGQAPEAVQKAPEAGAQPRASGECRRLTFWRLITMRVQCDTQRNEFFIFPPISIKFAVLPLCTKCTQLSIIDSETSPLAEHRSVEAWQWTGDGNENKNVSYSVECKVETFRLIKLAN